MTYPGKKTHGATKARNDLKWEAFREDVGKMYIDEDQTLPVTQKMVEEKHGFKASDRNWKKKLEEWGFEKYVTSKTKTILVQKSENRSRDKGKETEFFHRGKLIPRETLESFKRQKMSHDHVEMDVTTDVSTPQNITYCTPRDHMRGWEEISNALPDSSDGRISHPNSQDDTTLDLFPAKTVPNSDEEQMHMDLGDEVDVQHTPRSTPSLVVPFPGKRLKLLKEAVLDKFKEPQLIQYLVNFSKAISVIEFEHLGGILLRRELHLLTWQDYNTEYGQQDAYATLLRVSVDKCGPGNLVTLHLKCRDAFLLGHAGSFNMAQKKYEEVLNDLRFSSIGSQSMALMGVRCCMAISSILIAKDRHGRGYQLFVECFSTHLFDLIDINLHGDSLDIPPDFQFSWPTLATKADRTTMVLKRLESWFVGPYDRVRPHDDYFIFLLDIVRTIAQLATQGYPADRKIMDLIYRKLIEETAGETSVMIEKNLIYRQCRIYYEVVGDLDMLDKVKLLMHTRSDLDGDHPQSTTQMDSDEEDLFPDHDYDDSKSKYGMTYTESTITGISYSKYMVS